MNGAGARDHRVHGLAKSTNSAGPRHTTTTRSAGRTRWTRRTSGRNKSPRTGAAPATARSCTGPTVRRPAARSARQFHHVIDIAPTILEAAGLPEPTFVNGVQQRPLHGVSMSYTSTRPARRAPTRPSTSRCSSTAASTTRAGPRSPATAYPGYGPLPAFDDDAGSSTPPRLDPGARPRRRAPGKLAELQRLFLIEAPSTTCYRWTIAASNGSTPTSRGAPLISGNTQLLFGGMGRLTENSVLTSRTSRTRSPPRSRARGRRHGRDHRPGRRVRRLVPVRSRTAGRPTATTCSGCSGSRSTAPPAMPAGDHQVRLEFAYDGGGLAKGGTALYVDGDQGRRGPGRRDRADAVLRRRDHRIGRDTGTPVSDDYRPRRAATSPARCAGCSSTSARMRRTSTTSSPPRNGCASRWPASSAPGGLRA